MVRKAVEGVFAMKKNTAFSGFACTDAAGGNLLQSSRKGPSSTIPDPEA